MFVSFLSYHDGWKQLYHALDVLFAPRKRRLTISTCFVCSLSFAGLIMTALVLAPKGPISSFLECGYGFCYDFFVSVFKRVSTAVESVCFEQLAHCS